jgi:hypothetical protein
MTNKTVTRQAVRERAAALGAGKKIDPVSHGLNESVADANVAALETAAAEMRAPAREATRPMAPLPPGAVVGRDGEVLVRNRKGTINTFEVPEHLKDPDYDYNWKTESVLNQPDMPRYMGYLENGWRPVLATGRWFGVLTPKLDDKGLPYNGPVRRDGQVLMERPIQLSLEAQQDERNAARQQMRTQLEGARMSLPSGFSDNHNAVKFQNRTSIVPGPAPTKGTLISD